MNSILNRCVRKLQHLISNDAGSQANSNSKLQEVFIRVIGRAPNADELLHWSRTSIEQVERSLKATFEYEQRLSCEDVVLVDLNSFKLYCRNSDLDVGSTIIRTREHEPHVAAVLKSVVSPGKVVVDLGANIGYFSLLAATLVGPTGKIISFEPNAQNLRLLYASIVENGFKNIVVMPFAASFEPNIFRMQAFGSNGFLDAVTPGQSGAQYVQAVVLDEILQGVAAVHVIKMDVEGFEPLAVRGMSYILEKHRPILITEFSPWHIEHRSSLQPKAYLDQLVSKQYRLSIIESSGELTPMDGAESIMKLWGSFNNEFLQLDLLARPA